MAGTLPEFGIAANYFYNCATLHLIYYTGDVMPYHGAWHSAYLGSKYAPEMLSPRARQALNQTGGSDSFGYIGGFDYADRIHLMAWDAAAQNQPVGFASPWGSFPKARLHDNVMRGAVVEAVRNHPRVAVLLYLSRKPIAIWAVLKSAFTEAPSRNWLWLLLTGSIGVALLMAFPDCELGLGRLTELVVVSGAAVVFAALPNLWAYPGLYAMSDMVLTAVAFVLLCLSAACCAAAHLLSVKMHPRNLAQACGS